MTFQKQRQYKDTFRHTKTDMTHHKNHTRGNVNGSSSGKLKVTPEGNLDLHKSEEHRQYYMDEHMRFFLIIKMCLKDNRLFK